ncbi:rod shape-determining protein MreC [Cetobacterium sp. SF1]|uniref:rod shape-determining protein MreC n=1 Tax=unclassified Cetobacterium TaxID=2630983 RepID=UPI003CED4614
MKINGNNKRKIEAIYIIIAIFIVFFVGKGAFKYFNDGVNRVFYPIQSRIYLIGQNVREKIDSIQKYHVLLQENTRLKEELSEKNMLTEQTKNLRDENKRLRQLLGITGEFTYDFKIGKVSFHQVRELYESFSISLGKNDGIRKNMVVLSGKNLIGRVDQVMDNYSIVQMITDQDSVVSVLDQNNILGVVRGNRNSEMYFEPTSNYEVDLKVGDKIYTSGVSDIYPKGLYVGYISDVDKNEKDPLKRYKVKTEVDVFDLNEIIVITGDKKLWQ